MSRHPLFGPSLPEELYTDTVFVKWTNDGRDSNLVSISLDVYNHMLVVKTTKGGKNTLLHINQLKVIINSLLFHHHVTLVFYIPSSLDSGVLYPIIMWLWCFISHHHLTLVFYIPSSRDSGVLYPIIAWLWCFIFLRSWWQWATNPRRQGK